MIRRIVSTILFFLSLSPHLAGQERVYFGFNANTHSELSIFPNDDYALAASSNFAGERIGLLAYFNACGDTLWTKKLFAGLTFRKVIRIQNDGQNLWLAASLGSTRDTAIALLKYNRSGQLLLSKSIRAPIDFVWYQFHLDRDGNLYFTGNSTQTGGLSNTVLKLNPQAIPIHAFQYGDIFIWGMSTPAPSGGILNIAGRTVYKLDDAGSVEWITQLQNFQQSEIPPIALSDGYLIFHQYIGAIDRAGVSKLDLQGNLVWSSENYVFIYPRAASLRPNGNLLMLYTNFGPGAGIDWGILELDQNGNYVSAYTFPFSTGDIIGARSIANYQDGFLIHGLIDFNFAAYQAFNIRKIESDFSDLKSCPATLTVVSNEPSFQSVDTVNVPSFTANPYSGFNIRNANFPSSGAGLTENLFCAVPSDSFNFDLGPDLLICPNDERYLSVNLSGSSQQILWNTGAQSDSILITGPGIYWCELRDPCGSSTFRDSIRIDYYPSIELEAKFEPEFPVVGDSITLSARPDNLPVIWAFGDTSFIGNPIRLASSSAMLEGISASYTDTNNCFFADTLFPLFADAQLFLPNAFTPNGDGLNETFGPDPNLVYDFELQIFDRFGKQQAHLKNQGWDGSELKQGSYVYFLNYQLSPDGERRILRGIVNLIR